LLIHAEDRARGIVRPFIGFQHFFHAGDELRVGLWRNRPVLKLAVGHAVFFSVVRTVSWLMASTISKATSWRAKSRSVQLA